MVGGGGKGQLRPDAGKKHRALIWVIGRIREVGTFD